MRIENANFTQATVTLTYEEVANIRKAIDLLHMNCKTICLSSPYANMAKDIHLLEQQMINSDINDI